MNGTVMFEPMEGFLKEVATAVSINLIVAEANEPLHFVLRVLQRAGYCNRTVSLGQWLLRGLTLVDCRRKDLTESVTNANEFAENRIDSCSVRPKPALCKQIRG